MIGCRSGSVWIFFFLLCYLFSWRFAVRNWSQTVRNWTSCHPQEPTGTTNRKGFLSANQMEKPSFLTTWSCRRNTDGEPSRIVFLTAFRSFLTVFGRQECAVFLVMNQCNLTRVAFAMTATGCKIKHDWHLHNIIVFQIYRIFKLLPLSQNINTSRFS